jgi:ribose transport system ATP-binding protein
MFDEPTKGIDVAAKEDIFKIMVDFAEKGLSVIFISSDLEEIIRISHRVIVMRGGRIVEELTGEKINLKEITYSALNG